MKAAQLFSIGVGLATAACGSGPVEVDHPFYLMSIEDPREIALFRCPDEPGVGCAIDGLPGPFVTAAGSNARFVVVARQPSSGGEGATSYYYFERVPEERADGATTRARCTARLGAYCNVPQQGRKQA